MITTPAEADRNPPPSHQKEYPSTTSNPNPACEESFWHLCAFDFSLRSFRDSLAVRTCRARAPLVVLIGVGGQIKLLPLYVSMNTHAAGNTGFERTDAGKTTCGRKDLHPRVQEAAGTRPASSVQHPAYPSFFSFFRARTLEVFQHSGVMRGMLASDPYWSSTCLATMRAPTAPATLPC